MPLNDAGCDVWTQQFGEENYEKVFAFLFPQVFCKYRYHDFLFESGIPDYKRIPTEPWEYLVAADWHDEQGLCEVAELLRLCVSWDFQPPSGRLRELADAIRNEQFGYWKWTLRRMGDDVLAEIEKVFEAYTR